MSVVLVPEVGEAPHNEEGAVGQHEAVKQEGVAGGEVANETVLVSSCMYGSLTAIIIPTSTMISLTTERAHFSIEECRT